MIALQSDEQHRVKVRETFKLLQEIENGINSTIAPLLGSANDATLKKLFFPKKGEIGLEAVKDNTTGKIKGYSLIYNTGKDIVHLTSQDAPSVVNTRKLSAFLYQLEMVAKNDPVKYQSQWNKKLGGFVNRLGSFVKNMSIRILSGTISMIPLINRLKLKPLKDFVHSVTTPHVNTKFALGDDERQDIIERFNNIMKLAKDSNEQKEKLKYYYIQIENLLNSEKHGFKHILASLNRNHILNKGLFDPKPGEIGIKYNSEAGRFSLVYAYEKNGRKYLQEGFYDYNHFLSLDPADRDKFLKKLETIMEHVEQGSYEEFQDELENGSGLPPSKKSPVPPPTDTPNTPNTPSELQETIKRIQQKMNTLSSLVEDESRTSRVDNNIIELIKSTINTADNAIESIESSNNNPVLLKLLSNIEDNIDAGIRILTDNGPDDRDDKSNAEVPKSKSEPEPLQL